MTDLERAIAVIADLCGAGRPGVKESAEELSEWAEEFTDRYFDAQKSERASMNPLDHYKAYLAAHQVAENFLLAYARAESGDDTASYTRERAVQEVRKLAALLGFQLVPADEAKSEAA